MKIGLLYDTREAHGQTNTNLEWCHLPSRKTINDIIDILQESGYIVTGIEGKDAIYSALLQNKFDIVLPICNSSNGTGQQVWIQTVLELFNIPFIGSSARSILVSSDKYLVNLFAENQNIRSIPGKIVVDEKGVEYLSNFKFPCIIKPNFESDSKGIYLVHNEKELKDKAKLIWQIYKQKVICQPFISGQEITVSMYEEKGVPKVFGMAEILDVNDQPYAVYSFEYKHMLKSKKKRPNISKEVYQYIYNSAYALYKYFEFRDYARIDYRLDEEGKPYLLEATPTPSLPLSASFFQGGVLYGTTPTDVLKKIIDNAIYRYQI